MDEIFEAPNKSNLAWESWLINGEPGKFQFTFDYLSQKVHFLQAFQNLYRDSDFGDRKQLNNLAIPDVKDQVVTNIVNFMDKCLKHQHATPLILLLSDIDALTDGLLDIFTSKRKDTCEDIIRTMSEKTKARREGGAFYNHQVWTETDFWIKNAKIGVDVLRKHPLKEASLETYIENLVNSVYGTRLNEVIQIFYHMTDMRYKNEDKFNLIRDALKDVTMETAYEDLMPKNGTTDKRLFSRSSWQIEEFFYCFL